MAKIVALLDSMWGWGGHNEPGEEAPRYFRINPDNHSGRRLYQLCGDHQLLVTNSCRKVQAHANAHGKPDIEWVRENLLFLQKQGMDLLLVCGRVAQDTFAKVCRRSGPCSEFGEVGIDHTCDDRVTYYAIDHPAARRWSYAKMNAVAERIAAICRG